MFILHQGSINILQTMNDIFLSLLPVDVNNETSILSFIDFHQIRKNTIKAVCLPRHALP